MWRYSGMEAYKQEFIHFMVDSDVLKFGDFTLKSGRKSPFFMNAGAYVTGSQLKKLGEYYAKAIHARYGDDFDVLFGPAYKGIPLGVVTAIAYSELYGKEVRYCSDRKEEKDHGADKGSFLGSKLKDGDRVIMIEDVTTSGKSMEETVPRRQCRKSAERLMWRSSGLWYPWTAWKSEKAARNAPLMRSGIFTDLIRRPL